MNTKVLAGVVAVVIIIVAVVAVGLSMKGDDSNTGFTGVVYDGNGGTTSNGDTTFRLTSHEVYTNMFTNNGYCFDGWNTKADGTGQAYTPGSHIDYGDHKYVTLYAQWTYGINLGLSSIVGLSYYIVDGDGQSYAIKYDNNPLPKDGAAGIAVLAPSGTTWVKNSDGSFTGTNGNTTYTLRVSLENATVASAEVSSKNPAMVAVLFTYSGNVTGDIYASISHGVVPAQ